MTRKPDARTFGQDLMRGEHTVAGGGRVKRATAVPGGGATPSGKSAHMLKSGDGYATAAEIAAAGGDAAQASGTSIFDPVLVELACRWFCPPGGAILDPFAGGSVRGIVAAKLGFHYTGIDLSARQIAANRVQGEKICPENVPNWINGNSLDIEALAGNGGQRYDFVFSCPPYF